MVRLARGDAAEALLEFDREIVLGCRAALWPGVRDERPRRRRIRASGHPAMPARPSSGSARRSACFPITPARWSAWAPRFAPTAKRSPPMPRSRARRAPSRRCAAAAGAAKPRWSRRFTTPSGAGRTTPSPRSTGCSTRRNCRSPAGRSRSSRCWPRCADAGVSERPDQAGGAGAVVLPQPLALRSRAAVRSRVRDRARGGREPANPEPRPAIFTLLQPPFRTSQRARPYRGRHGRPDSAPLSTPRDRDSRRPAVVVNDVHSQLNPTRVARVLRPASAAELQERRRARRPATASRSACAAAATRWAVSSSASGTTLVDMTGLATGDRRRRRTRAGDRRRRHRLGAADQSPALDVPGSPRTRGASSRSRPARIA